MGKEKGELGENSYSYRTGRFCTIGFTVSFNFWKDKLFPYFSLIFP